MTQPSDSLRKVRVATIDSGVNPGHPHVRPIAGGVHIKPEGEDAAYLDYLGHGTAVAGAIREKAPDVEIYAVKVFDRALVTSGRVLLRALDWCLENKIDFVNLSLGTLNASYASEFEARISRARDRGTLIVAAFQTNGQPVLPGALPGVAAVLVDNLCSRAEYVTENKDGRLIYKAAGYPRDIPGVPPLSNLNGISFAVANVTGFLAAEAHAGEFRPA